MVVSNSELLNVVDSVEIVLILDIKVIDETVLSGALEDEVNRVGTSVLAVKVEIVVSQIVVVGVVDVV